MADTPDAPRRPTVIARRPKRPWRSIVPDAENRTADMPGCMTTTINRRLSRHGASIDIVANWCSRTNEVAGVQANEIATLIRSEGLYTLEDLLSVSCDKVCDMLAKKGVEHGTCLAIKKAHEHFEVLLRRCDAGDAAAVQSELREVLHGPNAAKATGDGAAVQSELREVLHGPNAAKATEDERARTATRRPVVIADCACALSTSPALPHRAPR